ncbi:MAG TPA: homoaconitase [Candidatus Marinimicrobia bacterium]|nr:homoaconitase [Candidatus Neomarinimicrobiota bacterium]
MGQNLIEKVVQRHAVGSGDAVKSGDYVRLHPRHVMTHDNTGAVIPKFREIGAKAMADPRQPVFALDHNVQDTSEKNLEKYRKIEAFAANMGVDFYPAGRGIGHQIMCEQGYAFPGTLVVASDSHSNMYGGIGCLGTPVVRTDAAAIWATGQTWWQIPPVTKIILTGHLKPGVTGKDVILTLCGLFNRDEVLNHALEFSGDGVLSLSINDRLAMANMTTEWGALAGLFPIDIKTIEWMNKRYEAIRRFGLPGVMSDGDNKGEHPRINPDTLKKLREMDLQPDKDAVYIQEITLALNSVVPVVSGPHNVKTFIPAIETESKKIKIDKAYLLSCVNSRVEDLAAAAEVVRGKKVAPGVSFYVAAASSEVQKTSEERGDWQALLDAGAIVLPPGCGPCIGLGTGLLEDGEVGISATNRNFKGRMGSRDARAYLASPAVVAASAVAGYISSIKAEESPKAFATQVVNKTVSSESVLKLIPGFPEITEGEIIFCPADNMNTDGIYPGKYTYNDAMTPEEQAAVAMENYDPDFQNKAKEGDILAGGFNFGSGSSREQAATALKFRGIKLIIAGSFSQTYKRNAINNGFMVVESPDFIRYLLKEKGKDALTFRTGLKAVVDWKTRMIHVQNEMFTMDGLGTAAQELILKDGLNNWVRDALKEKG